MQRSQVTDSLMVQLKNFSISILLKPTKARFSPFACFFSFYLCWAVSFFNWSIMASMNVCASPSLCGSAFGILLWMAFLKTFICSRSYLLDLA